MLNSNIFFNIFTIITLVTLQVFLFNNINFNGIINPYPYIIFTLLYPPYKSKYALLLYCFLLGFGIDWLEGTGGVHTFSTVLIGFLRTPLLKVMAGKQELKMNEFNLSDLNSLQWLFYIIFLVLLHHLTLFMLESFTLINSLETVIKALFSSIFTIILIVLYVTLFSRRTKNI